MLHQELLWVVFLQKSSRTYRKIKVIAINGSPRKNKNTAIMLQSALEGAKANGAETELINLYDYEYRTWKEHHKIRNDYGRNTYRLQQADSTGD